jgi:hypothetical protein
MGNSFGFTPRLRVLAVVALFVALGVPTSCGGRGPLLGTGEDGNGGYGSRHAPTDKNGEGGGGEGAMGAECREGHELCDGVCTSVSFDPENCGECGKVCREGELCSNGQCGVSCGPGTEQCGDRCVDTAIDFENCGECGKVCQAGESCSGGVCGKGCASGQNLCNGVCVDLELDPDNCGACGKACDEGELCSVGTCGATCVGGTIQCGNRCVDAENDPTHCGNCFTSCGEHEVCSQGECSLDCLGGTTRCGELCVDTAIDTKNCGTCGHACGADEVCSGGKCASVCGGGLLKCKNQCVDPKEDPANCGGCGKVCGLGQKCVGGACEDCDSSVEDCDKDGWLVADGDCCDKPGFCGLEPSLVNPGAIEVLGNGVDDDCNGKADLFDLGDLEPCDHALSSNSSDPADYARAFGICKVTEEDPIDPRQRTWGLIEAKILRADGSELVDVRARSIRPNFGNISTTQGSAMVVLSTGIAADATQTDPGPNGGAPDGVNISNAHVPQSVVDISTCTAPECVRDWFATENLPLKHASQLPRAPDCGADSPTPTANDSVMLVLRMRAPTNVRAFSYNSYFLSAEYPEYVCSSYNDQFVALVDTPSGTPSPIPNPIDKNLSTYIQGGSQWPIGINVAKGTSLFSVCAPQANNPCWVPKVNPASCSLGTADLSGTGFEAPAGVFEECTIGGGTHWLTTAGNVIPGQIVELRIAIWDVGDLAYDSTALIDGFQWLPGATPPGTN